MLEPLWGLTSADCMDAFLDAGIEAKVVVVDAGVLGKEHLGRTVDRDFVASLPEGCDPSGELGEYHSFVVDAPYFRHRITARAERITQSAVSQAVARSGIDRLLELDAELAAAATEVAP